MDLNNSECLSVVETNTLEITPNNELPVYLDSLSVELEETIETTESTEIFQNIPQTTPEAPEYATRNILSESEKHLLNELDECVILLADTKERREDISSNKSQSDPGHILKFNDTVNAKCLLVCDELLPTENVSPSKESLLEASANHVTKSPNLAETVDNDATTKTFSPEAEFANDNIGIVELIITQSECFDKGGLADNQSADCVDELPLQNIDSLSNILLTKDNPDLVNTDLKQNACKESLPDYSAGCKSNVNETNNTKPSILNSEHSVSKSFHQIQIPDYSAGCKSIVNETNNTKPSILNSEHSVSKSIHQIQIPVNIMVIKNPPSYQSKPPARSGIPTPQPVFKPNFRMQNLVSSIKPNIHTQNLASSSKPFGTMERKIGLLRKVVHRPRVLSRPENKETIKVVANNQSNVNLPPANVSDPSKSASSAQTKETTTTSNAPVSTSDPTNKKGPIEKKKCNKFKGRKTTRKKNISPKKTTFSRKPRSPRVVLKEKPRPLNNPLSVATDGNIPESQRNYGQCIINVGAQDQPSVEDSRLSEVSPDSESSSASSDEWPYRNKYYRSSGTHTSLHSLDRSSDSSDSEGVSIECKLVELKMRLMREEGFFSRRKPEENPKRWVTPPAKINKIKAAIAFLSAKMSKQRLVRKMSKESRKRNNTNLANLRSTQMNLSSPIKPCFVKLFRLNLDSTMLNLAVSTNLPNVDLCHSDHANEVQAQEREFKLEPNLSDHSEDCYLGKETLLSYEENPCTTSTYENNLLGVTIKKEITESIISIETNDFTSNIELGGMKEEIAVILENNLQNDSMNTELLGIKTESAISIEENLQGNNWNRAHCIDNTTDIEISGSGSKNSKPLSDSEYSSTYKCNAISANRLKVSRRRGRRRRGKRLGKKLPCSLNKRISSSQEHSTAVTEYEAMCDDIPCTSGSPNTVSRPTQIPESSRTELENMSANTFKDGSLNSNLDESENMISQAHTDCKLYEALSSDDISDSKSTTQLHPNKRKLKDSECVKKSTVRKHPGLTKNSEIQRKKSSQSHSAKEKFPDNKKPKLCNSIAQPLTTRRIVFGPSASSDEDEDSTEISLANSSFRKTEKVALSDSTSLDFTDSSKSLGTLCNSESQIDGKRNYNSSEKLSAASNSNEEGSYFVSSSDKYANLLKLVEEKSRLLKLCRQKFPQ